MVFYNLSAQHSTAGGNFLFFTTYIKTSYKKKDVFVFLRSGE